MFKEKSDVKGKPYVRETYFVKCKKTYIKGKTLCEGKHIRFYRYVKGKTVYVKGKTLC